MTGPTLKSLRLLSVILFALLLWGCGSPQPADENETQKPPDAAEKPAAPMPPEQQEVDYSSYFNGMNGSAVFFTPSQNQYDVYNPIQAVEQRSPCSTFKIISSLLALQDGIIDPSDSIRPWSGEKFWMDAWNQDLDFETAFQTSCVWYFRQVIDEIGKERIEKGLESLSYGNRDISDWEGRLNNNNSNPTLTGFWIESSLKISPMQQAAAMAEIFEPGSQYSASVIAELKNVMLTEQTLSDYPIYGKTGSGKSNNIWVDGWFVGFIQRNSGNTYFAVYLGETEGIEISSRAAKEIAIEIARDFYNQ